jgi:hypothetical protein
VVQVRIRKVVQVRIRKVVQVRIRKVVQTDKQTGIRRLVLKLLRLPF